MKKIYISVILRFLLFILGCRHEHYSLDDKKRICYRIVDTVYLTWSNAEKYCKNDGGHLITLDVEEKIALYLMLFKIVSLCFYKSVGSMT